MLRVILVIKVLKETKVIQASQVTKVLKETKVIKV